MHKIVIMYIRYFVYNSVLQKYNVHYIILSYIRCTNSNSGESALQARKRDCTMKRKKLNTEVAEITEDMFAQDIPVKCCLCGRKIKLSQSHNPWPLVKGDTKEYTWHQDERCCYDCNEHQVLPARYMMIHALPSDDLEKSFLEMMPAQA